MAKERAQWRKKGKRRKRKTRKMPEAVKEELAEKKAEGETEKDKKYLERFTRSQVLHRRGIAQSRNRCQALINDHFRAQYGEVWREVKEGYRQHAEEQMALGRDGDEEE